MSQKSLHLVISLVLGFAAAACGGSDGVTPSGGTGGTQQQTTSGTGGTRASATKCASACCAASDNTTASASGKDACKSYCTARVAANCTDDVMDQAQCEQYFQCAVQNEGSANCQATSKEQMDCYRAQNDPCKADSCCESYMDKVHAACAE
jgi:hypothetical protein